MSMSSYRFRVGWVVVVAVCWGLLPSAGAEAERTVYLVNDEDDLGDDFQREDDCIVHDFTPVGQALHASGSSGGLLPYDDQASVRLDGKEYAYLLDDNVDADVLAALDDPSIDATILVLDDFRTADGLSYAYRIDDRALRAPGTPDEFMEDVSHGSMVMAHINALIRDTGVYDRHDSRDRRTVWTHTDSTNTLDVVGVQLEGIRGDYILFDDGFSHQLSAMLEEHASNAPVLVVNMSWVILPCLNVVDFLTFVEDHPSPSFVAYQDALAEAAESQGMRWMPRDVYVPHGDSPFALGPQQSDEAANVVFVASSGNQALPFELYPAAFTDVVSVGARDASDYSNAARVVATGGWFPLTYLCCDGATAIDGDRPDEGLAYAGTSFAAPSMSVFAALHAYPSCADTPDIRARTTNQVDSEDLTWTTCE